MPLRFSSSFAPTPATRFVPLLLLAGFASLNVTAAQTSPAETSPAAAEAFAGWLRAQRLVDGHKPLDLSTGMSLAVTRQRQMRKLLAGNPAEFVRQAMSSRDRAALPPELRSLIEHRIKSRGSFRLYCAGLPEANSAVPASTDGYLREVQMNGFRLKAFVFGNWQKQTSVADAAIEGIVLDDAIALGDSPSPSGQEAKGQPVGKYSPTTTGTNTLLYRIARFSDESSDPIDDATALSRMAQVRTFWLNNSAGAVSIRGLVNPGQVMDIVHITLPHPKSYGSTYNNNFGSLIDDARNAALALGYNYTNYNLDVVVTSNQGFSYAGRSYIGDQGCHLVSPNSTLRTAGHELGHNLGLNHANYWRTDSNLPFGKDSVPGGYVADSVNGEWVEYGHYFSIMSGQTSSEMDDPAKPHYAPAEKTQLGWLSGNQIAYIAASTTNRLFRHDHPATTGVPRGLCINLPASDYTGSGRQYWLGYRYAAWSTATNWLRNGLQVDVVESTYGLDGTTLLDMTPFSSDSQSPFFNPASKPASWWTIDNNDKVDSALIVGRSYDDSLAGIHITPIATGNNGSNEEYVDVVVNIGKFLSNRPPVIGDFTASSAQVSASQSVTFNVIPADPDGDPLAYAWDFGDGQVWTGSGLNSPVAVRSWSSPGQYRVTATVSDMKGGAVSRSLLITVGSPAATNQVWGRVLWAGLPLFHARVWTTNGAALYQAWTDTDGSYTLPGLAYSTAYTLNCRSDGLTFSPQFSNPLTLTSPVTVGIDFYANEPRPWGFGSTFSISGQVTYGGVGVTPVEVRAGSLLTTTDLSGNFQFTNLPPGTYILTAAKDKWQFSPPNLSVTLSSIDSRSNNFVRLAPHTISGRIDGIPATPDDSGPTVYLSNGRSTDAILAQWPTNAHWEYSLSDVPDGQYDLSAFLWSYRLDPANFTNLLTVTGDLTNVNLAGSSALVFGSIVGRITTYGVPLPGVAVTAILNNTNAGMGITDSEGYYSIDNLGDGTFTVSPNASGYSFSPPSLTGVYAGTSDNDFSASGTNLPPIVNSLVASPFVVANSDSNATLTISAAGDPPLVYAWDALSAIAPVDFKPPIGTNAATSVSFHAPGTYLFSVRVTDVHGFTVTSNLAVAVNPVPAAMAVSPYQARVAKGNSVAFHAKAWDQLGGSVSVTPSWSPSAGGTIDSSGLFVATTPGPWQIAAAAGNLAATSSVSVLATSQVPVLSLTFPSNGASLLQFEGIPGGSYQVQYASSLASPIWLPLVTNTADAYGRFLFLDTPPLSAAARFYRAFAP